MYKTERGCRINTIIWRLWYQKQVSEAGISDYISQFTVGCNYLSLSEIPASGTKVLISLTMVEALKTQEHISVKSLLKFKHFYLKKMHLKLSAPTCQPFCLNGLIYAIHYFLASCTMLKWCWSGVINDQIKYLVTWPSQTVMFLSQHPLVSHSGGLDYAWYYSHDAIT